MRITNIYVHNFKSLVHFEIDLARFNCLIGLNGCGKSTFLQFMDFLSQLMKGNIDQWFQDRSWEINDLKNKISEPNADLYFDIHFAFNDGSSGSWVGQFSFREKRCVQEVLQLGNMVFHIGCFAADTTSYYFHDYPEGAVPILATQARYSKFIILKLLDMADLSPKGKVNFKYQGSIFSVLDDPEILPQFYQLRDYIRSIESYDLLNPHFMRKKTRQSKGSIGVEGKYLAAFFAEIGKEKQHEIIHLLKTAYPQLDGIEVHSFVSGWKQLFLEEVYKEKAIKVPSRHVHDGMLRLLAMILQLHSDRPFLLFDEIENGINPELIGFLLKQLIDSEKQICVTTHSLMVINYLSDEVAIPGVHFFYKTKEGFTKSTPFCKIPCIAKKLEIMGPGEAMIDTSLERLANDWESGFFADKAEQ